MSARNVYISRRNFMKAGAVAAAMASLSVPAMAAPAGEENCLWSNITPRRSTQYGPVVGLDQGESLVWYGIPYGAAQSSAFAMSSRVKLPVSSLPRQRAGRQLKPNRPSR